MTLIGFGTVGMGLAQALGTNQALLAEKKVRLDLVAVADSKSAVVDKEGLDPLELVKRKRSSGRVGDSQMAAMDLIREVESDAIVEVTPGNPEDGEPALSHIKEGLKASRHVVSANKMPLALHYSELVEEAEKRKVSLRYSACVGGGIPILETGRACAIAEEIDGIEAVLNATSNFILTKMQDEKADYSAALKEAQSLGLAEADPSLDVDGFDAAAKLVILANHVMGSKLALGDVRPLVGIRGVTVDEVRRAASRGRAVRPLAVLRGGAEVGPREVDIRDPTNVYGATNAVVFRCRDSGPRVVAGPAGGGVATSRGVLRDLVELASKVGDQ